MHQLQSFIDEVHDLSYGRTDAHFRSTRPSFKPTVVFLLLGCLLALGTGVRFFF